MALVCFHLNEADIRRRRDQRVDNLLVLRRREQPVTAEGDDAEARFRALKRGGEITAVITEKVEIIHRPRDIEIGISIEAIDEIDPLVAKITLHLEFRIEAIGEAVTILQVAAEFAVQR